MIRIKETTYMKDVTPDELSKAEAKKLTKKIKEATDHLWYLLVDAREGKAWKALGYPTWDAYVKAEFGMGRSRSYQLLDQGKVVEALTVRRALKGLKVRATILCCFSASNIVSVARQVSGRVFIAADNDPIPKSNPFNGLGTGEHYSRKTGLPFGMPPDVGADFNDMEQNDGIFAVQRVLTAVMAGRSMA